MSQYEQNKPQEAYAPQVSAAPVEGYPQGPYVAPPPAGYPMKDGQANPQNHHHSAKTRSRGDGFWKGCCAALCCCCMLDACF